MPEAGETPIAETQSIEKSAYQTLTDALDSKSKELGSPIAVTLSTTNQSPDAKQPIRTARVLRSPVQKLDGTDAPKDQYVVITEKNDGSGGVEIYTAAPEASSDKAVMHNELTNGINSGGTNNVDQRGRPDAPFNGILMQSHGGEMAPTLFAPSGRPGFRLTPSDESTMLGAIKASMEAARAQTAMNEAAKAAAAKELAAAQRNAEILKQPVAPDPSEALVASALDALQAAPTPPAPTE